MLPLTLSGGKGGSIARHEWKEKEEDNEEDDNDDDDDAAL